jgi:hypothetical protein
MGQPAQRTADVIRAVIDIARHLHPEADLYELAEFLRRRLTPRGGWTVRR